MRRYRAMTWTLGFALLLPMAAWAQTAYTNRDASMRAGPNQEFPQVSRVGAGSSVYVNGCVEGYAWCDVTAGRDRGWIYADYLSYPYQNQPVSVISGGPLLGLPLVTFSVGPYWDSYYRNRPWYGKRSTWNNRPANWWYSAPAHRSYQPVVRPYPQRHHDGSRASNNRPPNYSQPRPPSQGQRAERPATGEWDQTSKSARTYSQQ